MASGGARGWRRLANAFIYSWAGFKACFRNEEAFRQEVFSLLILIPVGLWVGRTGLERALLVGVLLLVPLVELINSAIEAVVDRFGGEIHELSGRAKDIGSAAVLLAIFLAGIVWFLVLTGQA
ncbi:MAG: diacylglycerol kinase [Gammaproteobacteria bacterium]|nr:diacylglycerol kinase [Gammaproteobacteria bacterium]